MIKRNLAVLLIELAMMSDDAEILDYERLLMFQYKSPGPQLHVGSLAITSL